MLIDPLQRACLTGDVTNHVFTQIKCNRKTRSQHSKFESVKFTLSVKINTFSGFI